MKASATLLLLFMSVNLWAQSQPRQSLSKQIIQSTGDTITIPATIRTPAIQRHHHCYSYSKQKFKKTHPLVIIDGRRSKRRALKKLEPADIITIEIIKDKEALTSFGSDGKYGVLLITTNKSGKTNKS